MQIRKVVIFLLAFFDFNAQLVIDIACLHGYRLNEPIKNVNRLLKVRQTLF